MDRCRRTPAPTELRVGRDRPALGRARRADGAGGPARDGRLRRRRERARADARSTPRNAPSRRSPCSTSSPRGAWPTGSCSGGCARARTGRCTRRWRTPRQGRCCCSTCTRSSGARRCRRARDRVARPRCAGAVAPGPAGSRPRPPLRSRRSSCARLEPRVAPATRRALAERGDRGALDRTARAGDRDPAAVLAGERRCMISSSRSGVLERIGRWPNLTVERSPPRDHMFRALWLQRRVHESLDRALERALDRAGTRARDRRRAGGSLGDDGRRPADLAGSDGSTPQRPRGSRRLDAAPRRRARGRRRPVLASVTAPVARSSTRPRWCAASRRPGEPWFCLEQPDRDGSRWPALGSVRALEAGGADRFGDGSRGWRERPPPFADEAGGPPGCGPGARVGGFAFAADGGGVTPGGSGFARRR